MNVKHETRIFQQFTMKKIILFIAAMIAAIQLHAQWEPDIRLTDAPDSSWIDINHSWNIASSGDVVHVVWSDMRDGYSETYYKRSADKGETWGQDIRLPDDVNISRWPCIAVADTTVHVVWTDYRDGDSQIYYKRSLDEGLTWGADERLVNNPDLLTYPKRSSISISGQMVHVVWSDTRTGDEEIYYKRSTDDGATWSDDKRLTYASGRSYSASIAVSGDYVHVVWTDSRDGYLQVYCKSSLDQGTNWSEDTRLSTGVNTANLPSVAASGENVYVVWEDFTWGPGKIVLMASHDSGYDWDPPIILTNDPLNSIIPNIAISGSVIYVVWQYLVVYPYYHYDVLIKNSFDGGTTWSEESQLNDISMDSWNPSVALSGPDVHVVWCDFRDNNYEIYYKRNPSAGFPGSVEDNKTDHEGKTFIVYPNPADDWLKIVSARKYSGSIEMVVTDIYGKTVLSKKYKKVREYAIDVSFFSPGCYILRIHYENTMVIKKLLIVH